MKTILYIFAVGWLLIGLVALLGGQAPWMSSASQEFATASGPLSAAGIGWEWIWRFLMPSLLAGALAAMLGRLDKILEAIEFANEPEDAGEDPLEPEERADPYIGEGYLEVQPDSNHMKSKRDL